MTQHVTIALDDEELSRARALAESLGVTVEEYLRSIVTGSLSASGPIRAPLDISAVFDLGASAEPTDIGKDKDRLVGQAVWQEYLAETKPR